MRPFPALSKFQRARAVIVAVLSCLAFAPWSAAATKHVAKTGDDTHDGNTPETAYLTIAKAVQSIGPGDHLVLHAGIYEEAIIGKLPSGTSDQARTVVTNHDHDRVIIRPPKGPARVLEFSGGVSFISVIAHGPGEIVLDGTNVSHNVVKFSAPASGGVGEWPSHIRLENLEICRSPDSGILGFSRFCEFVNLEVHHNGRTVYDHGMYIEGADNLIDGCDIHHNYARGIQIFMSKKQADTVFASRNTVRNCRVHDNGLTPDALKPGIDADSGSGNRIHHNLIYGNGMFGVLIQMGGTNNEVFENTFHGNGTAAVLVKRSAGAGNRVHHNHASGAGTTAKFISEHPGAELRDNTTQSWRD